MVVMLVCESAPFPWEWNQAEEMVRRRVFLNLQAYGGYDLKSARVEFGREKVKADDG
jgi:hypothetical protein